MDWFFYDKDLRHERVNITNWELIINFSPVFKQLEDGRIFRPWVCEMFLEANFVLTKKRLVMK